MAGLLQERNGDDLMNSFTEQRARILDNLEYDRITRAMVALDWKWSGATPTVDEMKITVDHLLDIAHRVMEEKPSEQYWIIATGGFEVLARRRPNGEVMYSVTWSVTDAEGYSFF